METVTESRLGALPLTIIPDAAHQKIVGCLNAGNDALIHRQASMEDRYGLEVIAGIVTPQSGVKRLKLAASFAFNASIEIQEFTPVKENYLKTIRESYRTLLEAMGIYPTWVNNARKSVKLDDRKRKIAVATWFSPDKSDPPHMCYVSNDRQDDSARNKQILATPSEYDPSRVGEEIVNFMHLLGIAHRALGGNPGAEYLVDFIEPRKAGKNMPPAISTRSKHFGASNEAKSKSEDLSYKVKDREHAPRLPNPAARLEEVHGLHPYDREAIHDRLLAFRHPEHARLYGVESSGGALIYGPRGTGKTMLATAIANEIGAVMWQINASDVVTKFVGESAARTHGLIEDAIERSKKGPLVLLLNEMDSIIGAEIKDNDSSEREAALGAFKNGLEYIGTQIPGIFVIGTTNHIERIDQAVARDGRFDLLIELGLPDEVARQQILFDQLSWEIQGEQLFHRNMGDIHHLAAETAGFSGSAIAAIIKNCRRELFKLHLTNGELPSAVTKEEILEQIRKYKEQSRIF